MYSKSFVAAALLSLAAAQVSQSVQAVSSLASVLSSLVGAYDGNGLSGALAIQQSYDPLSSAVAGLNDAAGSVSASDITGDTASLLSSTLSQVAGLLDALVQKASAFSSVGASDIVKGDINGLGPDSASIISKFLAAGANSPELVQSLSGAVASVSSGFAAAASAYGATNPNIPEATAGGSSESSAAGSSAAGSSAAASSAAASSAAGSAPAAETSAAATSQAVAPVNGAVAAGAGFAAAAAGVAAMLI